MKVHWSLWVALVALIVIIVILSARREGYAPPRDENTLPPYTNDISNTVTTSNNLPYVDSTSNIVQVDSQTQIYKDMAGLDFQIQAGNPILNFIQGDPSSNVIYGDFVPHQSSAGSAEMYAYLGELDISEGKTVSNTSNLVAVPQNPTVMKTVYGVDVYGNLFKPTEVEMTSNDLAVSNLQYGFDAKGNQIHTGYINEKTGKLETKTEDNAQTYGFDKEGNLPPDAGQYNPSLTSPTIRYIGEVI
jgi:hypothetical protein